MALQNSQPDNKNFLSPIGFQFSVQKLPHVNFFCTGASIPTMTMGQIDQFQTPFVKLPVPGDKIFFSEFSINFRIDEDMKNFREIYDWINKIGFPDNFKQHPSQLRSNPKAAADDTVYSDASLIIMTNQYKPNIEVKFIDCYPIDLSSVDFDLSATDVQYLNGTASFAYRKYELTTIL